MYNILCVDDTPANLFILESLFEVHDSKYNIITVSGGYEALEILLIKTIDLILLDVMMPDIDGFETANLIKSNKITKNIPIIFLTAKRDNETIQNAFKYGVDYLSKPYDEFELFTRVDVQLELIEVKRKLERQIKFNQSVLDSQHNILFIHDNKGIVSANRSFLQFFNVKNVAEFNKQQSNIADLFMEYENFFSLNILNSNRKWTDDLSSDHQNDEYNVLIMDTSDFIPKAFRIEVNPLEDSDIFVVTLTDITKLTTQSKHFENKATYDTLTNVYNRSKFNDVFEVEVKTAQENDHPLVFAIFDIDFFKKVNDTHGHIIGDETLITFASAIQDNVRDVDTFARWGGEEFVLAISGANIDTAFEIVDNLIKIIEKTHFKTVEHITCSVGITEVLLTDKIDDILIRADEALYEAKDSGRNKVCVK